MTAFLEACVERQTGKIVRVAPPSLLNWTLKERDGDHLCVVRMDPGILRPKGQEDLFEDRLEKWFIDYPGEQLLLDRAVRHHRLALRRELTEPEHEAVERSVGHTRLWKIDPKHIRPNRALSLEHMTPEIVVPRLDLRMMAAASSYNVSGLAADGSLAYNGHSTWWAAEKGGGGEADVAAWAEDYNRGAGDLGPVAISGASYTPNATYYTRAYSAAGERHDGTRNGTVGAYLNVPNGNKGIENNLSFTRIEGLRIIVADGGSTTQGVNSGSAQTDGCVIDGNCITLIATAGAGIKIGVQCNGHLQTGDISQTVQNNIVYGPGGSANRHYGIMLAAQSSGHAATYSLYNNTVVHMGTGAGAGGFRWYESLGPLTIDSQNNVATDCAKSFRTDGGDPTIVQNYCASDDDRADDWETVGGSNLINQTPADLFVDAADDLNVKDVDSNLYHAGTDVSLTYDAVLNLWHPTTPSIGALEGFFGGPFPHYIRRLMQGGMIGMG